MDNTQFHTSYDELGYHSLLRTLGAPLQQALIDPDINEIMLNCDGSLFVEHNSKGMQSLGALSSAQGKSIIRTLASLTDKEIDPLHPIISLEIPYNGARFEGLLPPLVRNPIFSIRRHHSLKLSLLELCQSKMITTRQKQLLEQAIHEHWSILVSGATGSGKTTLVNALLNEIEEQNPLERIITIEDTPELTLKAPNHSCLYTNEHTSMSDLVRSSLRLRPDRIVVGEVRGPEALDLIDALSTGHSGGLCTIHAGTPQQALERLNLLISRHRAKPPNISSLINQALDLTVQFTRLPYRHISALARIQGATLTML